MPKFAVLSIGDVVQNVIVAPNLSVAEQVMGSTCVRINDDLLVSIGYTYSNGEFSAPTEESPE